MKRSGVIYVESPLLTARQWRLLEWFCKEVAKAVFLETLALAFIPSIIGIVEPPHFLIILGGTAFSLTLLLIAVILSKKGEQ